MSNTRPWGIALLWVGELVTLEVDGYSGATIRANKIISAIRDALNRGPYQW